jgi:PAS domain S-box-containing protein
MDRYFQLAFDESLIAKVVVGLDGRFLKVNRATCALLGYSEAELLSKGFREISHPEDLAPTEAALQPLLEGKQLSAWMEKRLIRKDGGMVWVIVSSVLVRAEDGAPLYRLTEAQDITDRKLAEEKLLEAELRFRTLSETSKTAIYVIQDGVFQYVNPALAELLGRSPEELTGSSPLDFVHPDDVTLVQEKFDQRLRGQVEAVDYEVRVVHKDGEIRYGHVYGGVTEYFAGRPALIGNIVDVTERQFVEGALRRSEAKFRAVIENSGEGIMFGDARGVISYRSPSYFRINGYTDEERLGRNGFEMAHPEDLERLQQVWAQVLKNPRGSFTAEYRTQHKNGEWLWVESTALNLLQDPDVQEIVFTTRVINERKQAELALQVSEQVARRAAEQLRMLNQMLINLTSDLDLEDLMQKLHEQCLRIGPIDTFYVLLYDEDSQMLSSLYVYKDGERRALPARNLRENPGVTGYVIEHPHTLYIPDSFEYPSWLPPLIKQSGKQSRSLVIVPLFFREKIIGVLSMQNNAANIYTPEQIRTLELFAPQVAIAIQNSRLYEQAQSERNLANALIDNLPGIFLLIDQSGQLRRWNRYIETSLGYRAEQTGAREVLSLVAPSEREKAAALMQRGFAGEDGWIETSLLAASGKEIPFYVIAARVQIGSQRYLSVMGIDITSRKNAETALRQQMEENSRRIHELQALTQISVALRQAQTRAEMIQILLKDSMHILEAQGGVLGLLNGNTLVLQGAAGLAVRFQGESIPKNKGACWGALQDGMPRFFDEQNEKISTVFLSLPGQTEVGLGSGLLTPLKSGEITIGILFLGYAAPLPVPADRRRLFAAIAEMAGVALHRVSMSEALEKIVADRSRELQTIYRVAASANPRLELRSIVQGALKLILPAVASDAGAVLLWDEQRSHFNVIAAQGLSSSEVGQLEQLDQNSLEAWTLLNRQPLVLANAASAERLMFKHRGPAPFAALPMMIGERAVGVLDISRPDGEPFNLEELTLLDFIADHLGLVVENSQLFQQVEDRAVLEERSRMARALHDSVTQLLYSAMLYAEGTARLAEKANWEQGRANLVELSQITRQALQEMRLMVYELRSPALHHDGLEKALQHRLEAVELRSGIRAAIVADRLPPIPEPVEEALYRIALEALNNSLKHAQAKNVTVFIRHTRKEILLCVRDDGLGFQVESQAHRGGMGMLSMNERVERLDGRLEIRSAPGGGCEVEAMLPLAGNKTGRSVPRRPKV